GNSVSAWGEVEARWESLDADEADELREERNPKRADQQKRRPRGAQQEGGRQTNHTRHRRQRGEDRLCPIKARWMAEDASIEAKREWPPRLSVRPGRNVSEHADDEHNEYTEPQLHQAVASECPQSMDRRIRQIGKPWRQVQSVDCGKAQHRHKQCDLR